jgi:cytohesin
MQIRKSFVAFGLVAAAIVVVAGWVGFAGPGLYARHVLKQADIELSTKEFVDSACREDIGTVILMLAAGMNVNATAADERRNNVQTTALYCAASRGNIKLIKLLVEHGASLELANQQNETPLFAAVNAPPRNFQPNFEAVTALLDKGAQINAKSDNGTVLHVACRSGNIKLVNFLLERGADPSITDARGLTPLNSCAVFSFNGAEFPFDKLLVKGVNINAVGPDGTTLLGRAVMSGNVKLAEKLLALGAAPNIPDATGDTPLAHAVRSIEMMGLLLDKGADINQQGRNGTALIAAIRSQALPAVGFLLSRGADPKIADQQGNTPLHHAAQFANMVPVIKMLIAHGASPNAANLEGNTPLHIAARSRAAPAVEELLADGARPNEKNYAGQTPLALEKAGGGQPFPIGAIGMAMPVPVAVQAGGGYVQPQQPSSGAQAEIEKTLIRHGGKM